MTVFLIFCGQKSVTPGVQLRIAPTTRITNRCWWGKATKNSRDPGLLRPRDRSTLRSPATEDGSRSEVEIGPKPVRNRSAFEKRAAGFEAMSRS